jgi:hypothetical protein
MVFSEISNGDTEGSHIFRPRGPYLRTLNTNYIELARFTPCTGPFARNEELYALYSSSDIIRVIKSRRLRLTGHVARMGERRGTDRVLMRKPERRRPFGRPRSRREDNTKMDIRKVGCGGMDWIDLAQDRNKWQALVNAVMYLYVP